MPMPPLKPDELRALLGHLLAGAAGHDEAYWVGQLTVERTQLVDNISTNWRVKATGSKRDREAIDHAIDVVRGEHPYVRW